MLREEVAFANALVLHSKENYCRRYIMGRETHLYHKIEPAQRPFSEYVVPHVKRFLFINEFDEIFKDIDVGKNPKIN